MKIFITGGTGFIGKHVVERLQGGKHSLLLLCRNPEKAKKLFSKQKNIAFMKGDLSRIDLWKGALRRFKPEGALHCAAEGIPDYGFSVASKNLRYGLALIRALGEAGCKSMVTAGTCWEYTHPNAYAASKTALRELGHFAAKEYGMRFLWGRIFFAYGTGQKKDSLIPYLIANMKKGVSPRLKHPNAAEDFIHVRDVADALIAILLKSKKEYAVYNIGTGKATRVSEIVTRIARYFDISLPGFSKKIFPDVLVADNKTLQQELKWRPRVSMARGIKGMIDYF